MDMTFPIGIDLTRDPVVTIENGYLVRRWPGCSARIPLQDLGSAEVTMPMPNGCRSHDESSQKLLEAIWPILKDCTTARQLGKAIIDAGVPKMLKRPVALAARGRLGATWTDRTMQHWLQPATHTEERSEAMRAWRADPVNREREREASRDYYAENPEYQNNYAKARRQTDPVYAIAKRLRARLCKAVRAAGVGKSAVTFKLVGCTPEELAVHIESMFAEGMGWHNRGDWHVDHIRPLASFDLSDPEQQRSAMHYTNLKPVWATENMAKSSWHEGKRHRCRKPK